MIKQIEVSVNVDEITITGILASVSARYLNISEEQISAVIPLKRSIDARSKNIVCRILVDV